MQTIITHPGAEGYGRDLDIIDYHVSGARVIKVHTGKTGCRLVLGITDAGDYFVYVYGDSYRRLTLTEDRTEALRIMGNLTDEHGIDWSLTS